MYLKSGYAHAGAMHVQRVQLELFTVVVIKQKKHCGNGAMVPCLFVMWSDRAVFRQFNINISEIIGRIICIAMWWIFQFFNYIEINIVEYDKLLECAFDSVMEEN